MIRPDKHGLEYRSPPPTSQGSHRLTDSSPYVPPIPTPSNTFNPFYIEDFYPNAEFPFLHEHKPTTADIAVSANNSTTDVGLSVVNGDLFAFPYLSDVPQSDAFPGLPLTAPLDCYLQQSPPSPVKQVARGSISKDLELVLKCYYQHFKNTQ